MSTVALSVNVNLVSMLCGECGTHFAMPDWLKEKCLKEGRTFYCPNGHPRFYSDSENAQLRKALETEKQRADREKLRAESLKNDLNFEKGVRERVEKRLARTEKRARAGVCLDCHRTFKDVERHRAMKHGDAATKAAAIHEEKATREGAVEEPAAESKPEAKPLPTGRGKPAAEKLCPACGAKPCQCASEYEPPVDEPPAPDRFDCPACGPAVIVDEDGCCTLCGAEAIRVENGKPVEPPAPQSEPVEDSPNFVPDCQHERIGSGPRLPLRYGSAPTAVCLSCGAWRRADAVQPAIQWRPATELIISIARGSDE